MKYKYYHVPKNRTVYKFNIPPRISQELKPKWLKGTWYASIDAEVTIANNVFENNKWRYNIHEIYDNMYENKYSKEDVERYFMLSIIPANGIEISFDKYNKLFNEYKEESENNK